MRTLGEPDDDVSAAAWVQKFDLVREEKEKAQKRVRCSRSPYIVFILYYVVYSKQNILAEMDDEFGVGSLIAGTLAHSKEKVLFS